MKANLQAKLDGVTQAMDVNGFFTFTLAAPNTYLSLYLDVVDPTQNYVELRDYLTNLNYTLTIASNTAMMVIQHVLNTKVVFQLTDDIAMSNL